MALTLAPGESANLVAVYTLSDGTTRPADDATWAEDNDPVLALSATTGSAVSVAAVLDGVDNITASGFGSSGAPITSDPFEVDVVTPPPPVVITGITVAQA